MQTNFEENRITVGVTAIVQARLGSIRFPRKVLADLGGEPALRVLLTRLERAKTVDRIVVAIPDTPTNDALAHHLHHWGCDFIRGPEADVLGRFAVAAEAVPSGLIVRITGDCPFVDPLLVDEVVKRCHEVGAQYCRTAETFPDGFDVEVTSIETLLEANRTAWEPADREHVMPWIGRNAQTVHEVESDVTAPEGRVTLDDPEDLVVLRAVLSHFGHDHFTVSDVIKLMREQPQLFEANRHLQRNGGASMTTGEKLWRRAKEVIPGGNMLLSKRAEQFLPNGWPAYFSKAKGCEVWDLDGRKYFDLSLMGVGTNILGYGNPKVDDAVRKVIDQGNLSTLNCPEEVALAECLCDLHPWADMAKFARSGGEACAIAVRIARAASGKPAVAICGYHGWHDWYLSANLADDAALDGHLLPGLEPNGVPRQLHGLTRPFLYNDLEALRQILSAGDVGVVMMEVERSTPPAPGFLEGVRALTHEQGAVLIFDECTSGFRRNLGGLHMVYGVHPDLATFGKTMGNGYAITAVIGRREVMSSADSTFISSTFWTERIGPTAALATLEVMREEKAPELIHNIGGEIRGIWLDVAADLGLSLEFAGMPALSTFGIEGWDLLVAKQELLRRMLDRGYLGGMAVYASTAHTPEVLSTYRDVLCEVLGGMTADSSLMAQLSVRRSGADTFGRLA